MAVSEDGSASSAASSPHGIQEETSGLWCSRPVSNRASRELGGLDKRDSAGAVQPIRFDSPGVHTTLGRMRVNSVISSCQ